MTPLHWLTKCHQRSSGCIIFPSQVSDSRNLDFGSAVLLISLTDIVDRVSLSRLPQFVNVHLLLPKTLCAMPNWFGDCAHHPTRFVIISKLAQLRIISIIFLIFPILPMVGTCMIAKTIPHGAQQLLKWCWRLYGCQSCVFSIFQFFQLLLHCCLCGFNSLAYLTGLSFHMIFNPFLRLLVAWKQCFLWFSHRKLIFESQGLQLSESWDTF